MPSKLKTLTVIGKNVRRSLSIPNFRLAESAGVYLFRGFVRSDMPSIQNLYTSTTGLPLPLFNRLLLTLCGPRLCIVALAPDGSLVGFDQFFFNDRDLKENTVHEGYVAVAKTHERRGLASAMRRLSAKHFASAGLYGISTRISADNIASMASAVKTGFRSIENYIDPDTREARSYLVADISSFRSPALDSDKHVNIGAVHKRT